jgi:hypothetical protein
MQADDKTININKSNMGFTDYSISEHQEIGMKEIRESGYQEKERVAIKQGRV